MAVYTQFHKFTRHSEVLSPGPKTTRTLVRGGPTRPSPHRPRGGRRESSEIPRQSAGPIEIREVLSPKGHRNHSEVQSPRAGIPINVYPFCYAGISYQNFLCWFSSHFLRVLGVHLCKSCARGGVKRGTCAMGCNEPAPQSRRRREPAAVGRMRGRLSQLLAAA